MGCEIDSPFCDECHAKFDNLPEDEFEPCEECKKMLKTFCWVCNCDVEEEVVEGACESCRK